MATKKTPPKKTSQEKTIMTTFAGKVGHLAGEIVAGKNHLLEMAGDAIESVKSTIHDITTKKKKAPLKKTPQARSNAAVKKPVAATVEKATKAATSKTPSAAKKVVKKAAVPVKKATPAPAPKAPSSAKKAVKKAAKKVAGKK